MTDIGRKRVSNQDAFCQGEASGCQFVVLCDGMGGHQGGNVAAEIAVQSFYELFTERLKNGMRTKDLKNLIAAIIAIVSSRIAEAAVQSPELAGMGSTVVLAVRSGKKICIAHVGDSRCYLFRNGKLRRLTKDHSLVQEMIDRGEISVEESVNHPHRNVITRTLGYPDDSLPEILFSDVKNGDLFLLCTDGLTVPVSDSELKELLATIPPSQLAPVLVSCALEGGGPDNITVGILSEEESEGNDQ